MWHFIKTYPLRQWPYYMFGFIALVLTNFVTTLIPLKIKAIINLISTHGYQPAGLLLLLYSLLGLAVILAISRTLSRIFIFIPGRIVEYKLRNDLFKKLLTFPERYFRVNQLGDLMSRLMNDIQSLRLMSALGFLHIINTCMIYTLVVIQMLRIHTLLTLAVLLPVPLVMIAVRGFVTRLYRYNTQSQEKLGQVTHFFVESLACIRTVKSYHVEAALESLLKKENESFRDINIRLASIRATMFPFIGTIGSLGQVILFVVGGQLIMQGVITLGDFVAFSGYLILLAWPTASMAWIINIIQRGIVSLSRVQTILHENSYQEDPLYIDPILNICRPPEILCDQVRFKYNISGPLILKDISFKIKPGGTLGIFGGTGSGKSTLAKIIAGVEDVAYGTYRINGRSRQEYPLEVFRSAVSYVQQSPYLFSMSIAENIGFYAPASVSDSTFLSNIAKLACIESDILFFPNQYCTMVGEKGVILSGGQKSRLSLARAYAKPHCILILDDILAAVDVKTEKALIKYLKAKSQTPTTIIVSHRSSVMTMCDTIIVLDKGQLVDKGTHDELLSRPGIYKTTWEYQKMGAL